MWHLSVKCLILILLCWFSVRSVNSGLVQSLWFVFKNKYLFIHLFVMWYMCGPYCYYSSLPVCHVRHVWSLLLMLLQFFTHLSCDACVVLTVITVLYPPVCHVIHVWSLLLLIDWLMITYIVLFSALLSRLTALAYGSTCVTSFLIACFF